MKGCILLGLIVLSVLNGWASEIHFQTLGSVDGMSQSSAISIWQDPLGRMWLGNDALNCYDGSTVRVYRLSEYLEGVEDANLHTLTGNDSLLFIIAENQLISFDFQSETFRLTGIQTNSICCRDSSVFYFNKGVVYQWNTVTDEKQSILALPEEVAGVRDIKFYDETKLLLATPVGLYLVDIKEKKVLRQLLPEEDITHLMKDSHDYIWITTRSRNYYLVSDIYSDPWDIVSLNVIDKTLSRSDIHSLTEDVNGSVWLGTLSGLFQVSLQDITSEKYDLELLSHVMPESAVYALYTDRQGTLWVGSYYGDVRYFNPQVDNYRYYMTDEEHSERVHGAVIGDMVEDKNGNLYIITEGSGINIYNPVTDDFRHLTTDNGLRHNKIRSVWYDEPYDRVYFGDYMQGLAYYDVKSQKVYAVNHGELTTSYRRIVEDMKPYRGYLILHTQDGLFRLDRNTLTINYLFDDPELQEACGGIIRAIHVDEKDVLWVSSFERGLFTIDMKTRRILTYYGDGLMEGSKVPSAVIHFAESQQKGLFMSTLKSGVLRYIPQTNDFQHITEGQQLLLSNITYKLAFSRYGNLIVTTSKGVSVLNIPPRGTCSVLHHFRLSPSFPLTALSGDCGLFFSYKNNMVAVGGLYGLLFFSEEKLGMGSDDYSLYYSSLWVNNQLQPPGGKVMEKSLPYLRKIVLPYDRNTLNLTFVSTNYLSTRNVWHEYKMEGLEEIWTETNHRNIIYNSLRPGKYKLLLREAGNGSKTAELAITIQPPLWATTPAILVYILLAVLLIWAIVHFNRSKTMLKLSLEMERQENQRIEEANRSKMDFFINISNEFRTPLTLIISQLERLAYDLPAKGKKRLEKIRMQTMRLQDLITELLDFRKIETNSLALQVSNYDLNEFLKQISATYADIAEERQIHYRYRSQTKSVEIWFDKKQMQKVVYNLLMFVFRHASPGSSIELSMSIRNKWAEIQLVNDAEWIGDESIGYLFRLLNETAFTSPDLSLLPEGGMGIAFSRGIVSLHSGTLSVVREEGKTVFLLCLPLGNTHFSRRELENTPTGIEADRWDEIQPEENAYGDEDALEMEMEEKDLRLLIVETDEEIRSLLKESFAYLYDVVECSDVASAYEYAQTEAPDLIITEANLPDKEGAEFCNALRSNVRTLHIPVVVISSQPSEKQKADCVRSGADAYLVKPFNLDFLLLRCNSLVKFRRKVLRRNESVQAGSNGLEVTTNMRDKNFITLANRIIEENLENPDFDTTYWSKEMNIGRTRLFSQIKEITGMTPNDYILHKKMNKGAALLSETTFTIAEIAYKLGFSIPAYFSKCFKKQFGITPADYRRKLPK